MLPSLSVLACDVANLLRPKLGPLSFTYQKGGGAYGIRTRDLLNAIEALYQLS